jgi:hypothetical protein
MRNVLTSVAAAVAFLIFGSAAQATVTICNKFTVPIHVAFADPVGSTYTAVGWWSVPVNNCLNIPYTPQGQTFFYTADSDTFQGSNGPGHDHWGNALQLYVASNLTSQFNYTNAAQNRSGAKALQFSSATFDKPVAGAKTITLTFQQGSSNFNVTY